MPNRNIVTAIEAALDASLDDEHLIDHIATRVRPEPWTLAEERLRRWGRTARSPEGKVWGPACFTCIESGRRDPMLAAKRGVDSRRGPWESGKRVIEIQL